MEKQELEKRYEELDNQLFIAYMCDKYDGEKIRELEAELKDVCAKLGKEFKTLA